MLYTAGMGPGLILLLLASQQTQAKQPPLESDDSKETILPLTTKPLILPKPLAGKSPITISEIRDKKDGLTTRVFRYSWKEDYEKVVHRFWNRLTTKDGWKPEVDARNFYLSRELKSGPVASQALLFMHAKLVPPTQDAPRGNPILTPGWVWISYDEQMPLDSPNSP
jgi:hypothetical protein